MKRVTVSIYDVEDNEIVCVCALYPGEPGRMYMPNGDPGHPPEPDECEIESATLGMDPVELMEEQVERVEEKAWDAARDVPEQGPEWDD